jgi:hypothetical protein
VKGIGDLDGEYSQIMCVRMSMVDGILSCCVFRMCSAQRWFVDVVEVRSVLRCG